MTANDLHTAFKIELDKSSSLQTYSSLPGFIPIEIDYWLNKSVTQLVNNKLTGTNALQQPFEVSVKRIADLQKLIKTDKDINLTVPATTAEDIQNWFTIHNSIYLTDFANKASATGTFPRMFYIDSILNINRFEAALTEPNEITDSYNTNLVNHDIAKGFTKNKYNSPYMAEPVVVMQDNSIEVLLSYEMCSSAYIYTMDITYVKCPEKITYGSTTELTDFPEYVYSEIVSNAVLSALENMESKRAELKHQLNNTLE